MDSKLTIVDVTTGKNRLGIQWLNIGWIATIGMGECIFFREHGSNRWQIKSEGMSKEFCAKLLKLWLESCDIL